MRKETVRSAFLPHKRAAEPGIVGEDRRVEGGKRVGDGDRSGEVVARDIKALERRLIECGDRSVEKVLLEEKGDEAVHLGESRGKRSSEAIVRQVERAEGGKVEEGVREGAREDVAVEEERLEVLEAGEVGGGEGASEGVVLEAEDTEMVEAGEGGALGEATGESGGGEDETYHAAVDGAGDTRPTAVIGGGDEGEAVGGVDGGLESQKGVGVRTLGA